MCSHHSSSSHSPPPTPMAAAAMISIDAPTLSSFLPPSVLIPHLRSSLPSLSPSISSPPRLSFPISHPHNSNSNSNSNSNTDSLLIMPSWSLSPSLPYISVKLLTSFPSLSPSPSLHASLSLFHSLSGSPLATLDATFLTLLRTSSISALAASSLSLPSPSTLLLAGAGALAPHLISAHRHVHPSLTRFLIWNRTPSKSKHLAARLQEMEEKGAIFEHVEDLDGAVVGAADVVVCATGSERAIVRGELLKEGAHLSLVGSFRKEMRECDEAAVRRGRVFVDDVAAVEEAGELAGVEGVDVVGTLAELLGGKVEGRRREEEITVFKSVGSAVFDLLAAQLAYETYLKGSQ